MSNNLQINISPGTVYISTTPGQSSYAKLIVTVTNVAGTATGISGIAITLPDTLAPVNTLTSIVPGMDAATTALWDFAPSMFNVGEFDASPQSGDSVSINAGGGYTFILDMVTLPNSVLTPSAMVNATVTFADGTTFTQLLVVNIAPATAAITYFNAQLSIISPGQPATLEWQCTGIDHCILVPGNGTSLPASGSFTVNPPASTPYTLYAYAAGVILSAQWEITVENPTILYFGGINGSSVVNMGESIQLVWRCDQFAKKIAITTNNQLTIPDLLTNGNTLENGTVTIGPLTAPTAFQFTAWSANGAFYDQRSSTIGITDMAISSFTASSTNIWEKDKVTLSWSGSNVTSFDISPVVGMAQSPVDVFPEQTTTYTLTAKGFVGNLPTAITKNITITVNPVRINSFLLTPQIITLGTQQGNQCTLEWDVLAQVVSINQGSTQIFSEQVTGNIAVTGSQTMTTPPDGAIYTITIGTFQNPGLHTQPITLTNAYGPYVIKNISSATFPIGQFYPFKQQPPYFLTGPLINIQNPQPSLLAGYDGNIAGAQFTGISVINGSGPAYITNGGTSLFIPNSAVMWTDPADPTGTVTIVA